jgi:hypothetical protein
MENPELRNGIMRGKANPGLGPNQRPIQKKWLYGHGGERSDESNQMGHR